MAFLSKLKRHIGLYSIIYILVGIVLLAFPQSAIKVACNMIGISIMACGGVFIAKYISHRHNHYNAYIELLSGILLMLLGILVFFNYQFIASSIPVVVGMFIVVESTLKIANSFAYKAEGYSKWYLSLIFSFITFIFGSIILFNPFATATAIVMLIGYGILIDGIFGLITAFTLR